MNRQNSNNGGEKRVVPFFDFYETKAEKLVTALYMITNFFPDKEPMKWKLRDRGLLLLSDASTLKDKNSASRSDALVHSLNTVVEIISLLEIARLADFISEMNYMVLKREYVSIRDQIAARKEVRESVGNFTFGQSFFEAKFTDQSNWRPAPHVLGGEGSEQSEVKGQTMVPEAEAPQGASLDERVIASPTPERSVGFYPQQPVRPQSEHRSSGLKVVMKKNKRREFILEELKTKSEVTIKDISEKLTDCSEKTVQRELVAMVKEGVLTKKGERRWSRYSLANGQN